MPATTGLASSSSFKAPKSTFANWPRVGRVAASKVTDTNWIWALHADCHDFRAHDTRLHALTARVFSSHFGHLSLVLAWIGGIFMAGSRFSNYRAWLDRPAIYRPGAQPVPRTVPGFPSIGHDVVNGDVGGGFASIQITSGMFFIWRSHGFTSSSQLFSVAVASVVVALVLLAGGWYHYHVLAPRLEWFASIDSALNHHLAGLLGLGSLGWSGHIIHVSMPIQALLLLGVDPQLIPAPHRLLTTNTWLQLVAPGFSLRNLFTLNWEALGSGLTALGGLQPTTESLWLSDVAHHHLAVGVVFILAGHMYQTDFGIGISMSGVLAHHRLRLFNSCHLQLAIQLASLGSVSVWVGHVLAALPAYPFLLADYATVLSVFTHHQWIGGIFIVGGAAHASLALIFDWDLRAHPIIGQLLNHKTALVVHLNWVCIFLGFHSFGLYVHNDTVGALGRAYDQFSDQGIVLVPVFARNIQSLVYAPSISALGSRVAGRVFGLGTADTLVHHVHAFTVHVTTLILLKGLLFARGSRLVPDKARLGFRFPWDGPGRGGTWQVSAWDHIFLGLFWMYNAISVVVFHFSWKIQSDVWATDAGGLRQLTARNFASWSVTINGWLRDFLWSQSSQVIQSYGSPSAAYGLMFLGAHFIWAFSLMFLFSGRGYWQELIESIIWAHQVVVAAPAIYPRALSIIQGRAVGVAHFLLGGIVTTWAFFEARAIDLQP